MNTTGLVLIGAGAIGLYALSQNASAGASGGAGTGSPAPGSADAGMTSENPFANILESVKSFLSPATAPNAALSTQTPSDTLLSKKAASTTSETPLFAQNSANPFDTTSASSSTRFTVDPNSGGGGVYDRYAQQSISNEVAIQRNNPFSIAAATETKKSSSTVSPDIKALFSGNSIGQPQSIDTSSNKSSSSSIGTTKKAAATAPANTTGVGKTVAKENSIAYKKGYIK